MSRATKCNIIPEDCSHVLSDIRTPAFVPTVFEKPVKTRDLDDISSPSKLAALKKADPFAYYSIPALRKDAWQSNERDVSVLRRDDRSIGRKITRQSRLSMECHADLLMENFVAEYHSIARSTEPTTSENCSHVSTKCTTTIIPTIFEKAVKTSHLNGVNSASKLAGLKKRDSFVCHSIPALRKAALHSNDARFSVRRRENRYISRKATRRTRVSMDCHADLLVDVPAANDSSESCDETVDNHDDLYENLFSF